MTSRPGAIAAWALAVCLVLPISTCTRHVDARGEAVAVLWWLEPLLLAASAYYVRRLASFGEPAAGAYLAASSIAVLATLWVYSLAARLGSRRRAA